MNLKPFDLERALAGDPVVTRIGKKVLEIYLWKSLNKMHRRLCYCIENDTPSYVHEDTGRLNFVEHNDSDHDLFMAPKIKTYWFNVFKYSQSGELWVPAAIYNSEEKALNAIGPTHTNWTYLKTISFEVEE